jgi:hypothetical protein
MSIAPRRRRRAAAWYLRYRTLCPIGFPRRKYHGRGGAGLLVSGTEIPPCPRGGQGPDVWTGGRFGPEGSAALQAFIFVVTAFYVWRVVVEKKLTPPPWKARSLEVTPAPPSAGR